MLYIKGKDRNQCVLFSESFDSLIDQDHVIRFLTILQNLLMMLNTDLKSISFRLKKGNITHQWVC